MNFATAINCMDGRVQLPVIKWISERYDVDYVDMVTEAGPVKVLADNGDAVLQESIRKRVEISVNKHRSKIVALVAHFDCAGNPVEKDIQIGQIKKSFETVRSWGFEVEIIGLWVDENWEVHQVM